MIGTVHGADVKELYQKPELGALLKRGVFGRLIVLSGKNGAGTVQECLEL